MDLGLKGKKAIVTGATRGIGRAIAETLAAEGADVAICARDPDQVKEAVKALKTRGVNVIGGVVDIADGGAFRAWITEAGQALGGIDILVSSAGAMAGQNNEKDWEANFKTDVLGAVRSIEAAKPFLEKAAAEKGDAAIVIIASAGAAEADEEGSYGPMKAALIHFAKGVARQQAPKRIRANVISPGAIYFKGGFWNAVQQNAPELFAAFMKRNPMGRLGSPQEVANAAVFLASPAASFTTGINMVIDGAFTARVNF